MTEFEKSVIERLDALTRAVESLRADFSISQITFFENLPPGAIVGLDYVAYKFGCTEAAARRGRFGTDKIRKLRKKPIAYVKRDVDVVWLNLSKSVSEVAAEIRYKTKKIRGEKKP